MIDMTSQDLTVISGAGDMNWVQAGRDVATTGAALAGGAFGAGIGGPVGAAVIGTAAAAGVGALYDGAGNQPLFHQKPGMQNKGGNATGTPMTSTTFVTDRLRRVACFRPGTQKVKINWPACNKAFQPRGSLTAGLMSLSV